MLSKPPFPKWPFGCLIWFKPTINPTTGQEKIPEKRNKASPSFMPGVFLGFHLRSGCTWCKEYLVARIEDFRKSKFSIYATDDMHDPHVYRVTGVYVDEAKDFEFPLKDTFDKVNLSLGPLSKIGVSRDGKELYEPEDDPEVFQVADHGRDQAGDRAAAAEPDDEADGAHCHRPDGPSM